MKKNIELLKQSIKKWDSIIDGTGVDEGIKNCPLCQEYWEEYGSGDCLYCPIREYTGETCCNGTPYTDWDMYCYHEYSESLPYKVFDKKSLSLAEEERDFIQRVLEWYKEEYNEM